MTRTTVPSARLATNAVRLSGWMTTATGSFPVATSESLMLVPAAKIEMESLSGFTIATRNSLSETAMALDFDERDRNGGSVGVGVIVTVGVRVGVLLGPGVFVIVAVVVPVGVPVGVSVGVTLNDGVTVGEAVFVRVRVRVDVGTATVLVAVGSGGQLDNAKLTAVMSTSTVTMPLPLSKAAADRDRLAPEQDVDADDQIADVDLIVATTVAGQACPDAARGEPATTASKATRPSHGPSASGLRLHRPSSQLRVRSSARNGCVLYRLLPCSDRPHQSYTPSDLREAPTAVRLSGGRVTGRSARPG